VRALRVMRTRRLLLVVAALLVALSVPAVAGATPPPALAHPYGEVGRYGCFGFGGQQCSGPSFSWPVGFAVAATEGSERNDVYVLSQTSPEYGEGELKYKLQKLASPEASTPGETLGVAESEQLYTELSHLTDAHPLIGLAVDPSEHRVYALVESVVLLPDRKNGPVADELVAWSTEPNSEHKLVRAPRPANTPMSLYEEEPLTHASVVAKFEPEDKQSTTEDLYAPEALAVDPLNHDVVVEAEKGVQGALEGGPTILEGIVTEGTKAGQIEGSWTAPSPPPGGEAPSGLVAKANGSLGIDLKVPSDGGEYIAPLEGISADTFAVGGSTSAEPLVSEEGPKSPNQDEALTISDELTPNGRVGTEGGRAGTGILMAFTAGSPIAELTGGNYAASYGTYSGGTDPQTEVSPWNGLSTFWAQEIPGDNGQGNMGVRVFNDEGKILTTIGGGSEGKPCNIPTARLAVAAGAGNSVFVLTQPNENDGENDDELIEFAEGAKGEDGKGGACPAPSDELEVGGQKVSSIEVNGTPLSLTEAGGVVTSSVTVHQGEFLNFDALKVDRAGEAPFEFDWDFEGKEKEGVDGEGDDLVSKIEAGKENVFSWPTPEAPHEYEDAGTYHAKLRLIGDYGASVFPFTVTVIPSKPAVAELTGPSTAVVGETVTFDATGSHGTPGSKIDDYEWEFGSDTLPEPTLPEEVTKTHTFTKEGKYEVKVTVAYEPHEGDVETISKEIPIAVGPCTENCGSSGGGSGGSGSGSSGSSGGSGSSSSGSNSSSGSSGSTVTPTPVAPVGPSSIVSPSSVVKPLTDAQKLADALKLCHKDKPHKKRASCEKVAKARYSPKKKQKHGKK
jgi:hypothetical protein